MKEQRSVGMCIVLSIVTCGIYALYWYACLTRDVNEVTRGAKTAEGGMAVLLDIVTCGIYGIYWAYRAGERLDAERTANGAPYGNLALVYLLLSIFGLGLIAYALVQNELNQFTLDGGN